VEVLVFFTFIGALRGHLCDSTAFLFNNAPIHQVSLSYGMYNHSEVIMLTNKQRYSAENITSLCCATPVEKD